MTEAEIIVKMREALDILKAKWQEAEGSWAIVDFMGAALDMERCHWVKTIVEAERLLQPYVDDAVKK